MGNWYKVTKTINGRPYDYWQRTTRVGNSVKTENKYIGPASRGASFSSGQFERTVDEHRELLSMADFTPPTAEVIEQEPAYRKADYSEHEWRELLVYKRQQKREYEAAMKVSSAKVRKAKRLTKGIKSANPFLAQVLVKK